MYREIAKANVFSGTAAFANTGRLNLTGNGTATIINGQLVSGDFFRTMGLKAAAGRLFEVTDDKPSAAPVAVLNYGYWESAFGGSGDVIGRTIELNNVPFTIIGVAEQRFTGITPGSDYDVWLPLSDAERISEIGLLQNRSSDVSNWWLTIVGRLKPGTQLASAQAAVSGLFRNEMLHGAMPLFHGDEIAVQPRARDGHGASGDQMFHGAMPPAVGSNDPARRVPAQQAPGDSAPVIRLGPPGATPEGGPRKLSKAEDNPEVTLVPAQTGLTGTRS